MKFDKKTVTLSQRSGQVKIEVPRSSIPKHYEIKTGNQVQAELDGSRVVKQMKEHAKEAEKRHAKLKKEVKEAEKKDQKSKLRRMKAKADKPVTVKFN